MRGSADRPGLSVPSRGLAHRHVFSSNYRCAKQNHCSCRPDAPHPVCDAQNVRTVHARGVQAPRPLGSAPRRIPAYQHGQLDTARDMLRIVEVGRSSSIGSREISSRCFHGPYFKLRLSLRLQPWKCPRSSLDRTRSVFGDRRGRGRPRLQFQFSTSSGAQRSALSAHVSESQRYGAPAYSTFFDTRICAAAGRSAHLYAQKATASNDARFTSTDALRCLMRMWPRLRTRGRLCWRRSDCVLVRCAWGMRAVTPTEGSPRRSLTSTTARSARCLSSIIAAAPHPRLLP
ncbi:hypothetical protein B0H15DRAFT_818826 [Mycena belliarum]|uniref:Uncharacterized protein n=1 Tax=Mycena belliarum TaxID=1033014 RepID=A0AAD6UES3_9AGAR|nr:hypothetical protein B0H15DRAFT_818826 [Mycena belliae]